MGEMDIELGHLNTNTIQEYAHQNFLQEVRDFEMLLKNVGNTVHKLKEANQQFISVTASASVKEIKGCMDKDIDEVQKMAHTMKPKLRKLIRNNVENRKNPGCEQGTDMDILRMKLIISLKKKLKERNRNLQNLGKTIQQENLEVIQRRISTVLSNVSGTVTGINLSNEVIRVTDAASIVRTVENKLQEQAESSSSPQWRRSKNGVPQAWISTRSFSSCNRFLQAWHLPWTRKRSWIMQSPRK